MIRLPGPLVGLLVLALVIVVVAAVIIALLPSKPKVTETHGSSVDGDPAP